MPLLRDGQGEKATTKQQKKQKKGRKEHTTKVNKTILYMWNTLSRNRKKNIHVTQAPLMGWLTRLDTFYRNRVD